MAHQQTNVPQHGQTVVFASVPPGSYCRAGEPYRVDRPNGRGDYRFVSVDRGSSTYDRPWAVSRSVWQATS